MAFMEADLARGPWFVGADFSAADIQMSFPVEAANQRAGLSPDGSSSYYLPRLIGLRRTQELMLTNRTLSAQEASQWGLVTEVLPDDQVAARADELASQMASTASGSNGAVKALMLSTFSSGLEEQMEFESRVIAGRAESADGREGVDAFMAKRKPEFA